MEILATIGTRGSPLALAQAHEVRDRLARAHDVAAERIAHAISRLLSAQASGVGIDVSTTEPLPLPPPKR